MRRGVASAAVHARPPLVAAAPASTLRASPLRRVAAPVLSVIRPSRPVTKQALRRHRLASPPAFLSLPRCRRCRPAPAVCRRPPPPHAAAARRLASATRSCRGGLPSLSPRNEGVPRYLYRWRRCRCPHPPHSPCCPAWLPSSSLPSSRRGGPPSLVAAAATPVLHISPQSFLLRASALPLPPLSIERTLSWCRPSSCCRLSPVLG